MRYFYIFIITLIFISFEKDGYAKMEKMNAYCKSINISIEIPKLKPQQI